MSFRHQFRIHVGRYSIGRVMADGCADELIIGSKIIDLSNFEISFIDCLMKSKLGLTKQQVIHSTSIPSVSLVEQVFSGLCEKLSTEEIANYAGNGSFCEDTIFAHELLSEEGGRYKFNRPLANLVGKKPILSDQQLASIRFLPKDHQPLACCR